MTKEQIEEVLFNAAKSFVSGKMSIGGKVYYRGMREAAKNETAFKEDVVVAVLTGEGKDVIKGSCLVNVYVPDIVALSGARYKDKPRCTEIGAALMLFDKFATEHQDNVYFVRREMIDTFAEEKINQHFVSLKMDFNVFNPYYNN